MKKMAYCMDDPSFTISKEMTIQLPPSDSDTLFEDLLQDFPPETLAMAYEFKWYRRAFKALIRCLGGNAKRAHPNRDARTERAQLGLKPVFELSDHKALRNSSGEPVAA